MRFPKLPIGIIVIFGFASALLFAYLSVLLVSTLPSLEESCKKKCSLNHRIGKLVYDYSPQQTAGMRGKGPMHCECF
jgi:hypothetical protein